MRKRPAVFLDRDGVINHDSDFYIKSWAEFRFFDDALEALRRLHQAGCEVYIVTNQQGVAKGLMSHRTLLDILLRLRLTVRDHGGLIHGIAYCRHLKDEGCACRKPEPGMLRKLAFKYGLDLSRSVIVGDSCTDIQCGQAVGCETILLHTREPERVSQHLERCATPPDHQCDSLLEAVDLILALPQFIGTAGVSPARRSALRARRPRSQ